MNNILFTNNMEKYAKPEAYDQTYNHFQNDLPLLLEWAVKKGGTAIDLACGTGRITIPIAENGLDIIGIDLNEGMLERAKKKSAEKNLSLKWFLQDCSSFMVNVESPFIFMTGNSFQHFLTNESQNALLQSVYHHLQEDGIFIFGTRFPKFTDLVTESTVEQTDHSIEYFEEEYNPITQILYSTSIRKISTEDGIIEEKDSISLRYVFPQEMDRLLEQNGLTVRHRYGTWDKKPLDGTSAEMIYICQKIVEE
ncbi:class I SAM-dependent DNA methyltransferase [Cytobacillus purgationiresistens]|uniref:Ubiquinone/menaquinone biosynthesis C-methylase UbiE n=1 Tax=Cytobacillus purgationiresistens TaxID=863449 RepID=A0ABU0AKQ2_9BACI|nr:class I SAM-dependent methyltransferase [Cytobacillus purgationiresistens]MDQ0271357.1 ubiquinone/menaquinone biosynthesis C-methylase UbiE [Cytobacillus purgationiresistens]